MVHEMQAFICENTLMLCLSQLRSNPYIQKPGNERERREDSKKTITNAETRCLNWLTVTS